jgi:hypothetical protein
MELIVKTTIAELKPESFTSISINPLQPEFLTVAVPGLGNWGYDTKTGVMAQYVSDEDFSTRVRSLKKRSANFEVEVAKSLD